MHMDSTMMMLAGTTTNHHHSTGILTKEEKEDNDLSGYNPDDLMMGSDSSLSLSLNEGEEEDHFNTSHDFNDIPPPSTSSASNPSSSTFPLDPLNKNNTPQETQPEPTIPRLMQMQMEKYGTSYFQRNESGHYTCFFVGCGKKLQANFSRHVAKHEQDGDAVDPNLAQHMKSSVPAGPPMQTCSHPFHQAWWHTPPEQPIGEFYNRSYKCKRCYIKQQMDRKKLRVATEKMENKELKLSSDALTAPTTPTHGTEITTFQDEDPSTSLPLSSLSSLPSDDAFPSPPSLSSLSSLPSMPSIPSVPSVPVVPSVPSVPNPISKAVPSHRHHTPTPPPPPNPPTVTSTPIPPPPPPSAIPLPNTLPPNSILNSTNTSATNLAPNSNSRSSSPPPKRKKVNHNTKDDLILPEGWTTHTTTRKNGKSAGRVVPHWVSPEGKKFRSKAAIKEFLAKTNPAYLPQDHHLPSSAPSSASSTSSSSSATDLPHHLHHPFILSSLPTATELPSSILTPLGDEDKIFGMSLHHQRDDDDDPILGVPNTNSPFSGFVNASFTGVLPQLQSVGTCKISGQPDGMGFVTQITIGDKVYKGFVLSEDFSVSPSSSPSAFPSSLETYNELDKHIQACQDIFLDDAAIRSKVMRVDMHSSSLHNPSHLHSNSSIMHPPLSSLHSNGHHSEFNDLDLDDDDDDDHHMGLGPLNGHLSVSHHSHHSHLTSHHPHSLPHPLHHMNHRGREAGSNSSTDTEEGLGGYDIKTEGLSGYDAFSSSDPDSFLNTKPHHSDLNNNNGNTDTIDGLDIIADDMPQEIDITKHTQDAPMHKQHSMGGLLNSHMLISPRHLMNV